MDCVAEEAERTGQIAVDSLYQHEAEVKTRKA
jgi:hypothetical protein